MLTVETIPTGFWEAFCTDHMILADYVDDYGSDIEPFLEGFTSHIRNKTIDQRLLTEAQGDIGMLNPWEELFRTAMASGYYSGGGPTITRCSPLDTTTPLWPVCLLSVKQIFHIREGENDGQSWLLVAQLWDKRFIAARGSCCYTGWDVAGGGQVEVAELYQDAIVLGLSQEERMAFDIRIPGDGGR